ncbi:PGPGW domain-containing protein [Sanguibacter antarcticus]|uniref:Uncharacterized protein (TIGR02611 family) n=1 Tax=Sanguibacter antarcticus TaxID=372484 RepID=A0A2A9E801_9MICO|nr:PGPGW domain-containing protein [Sanguibacter antarcticus]PFG34776.1 uncharacterized protein (TIGR02611 family) [Sanguibacter antarcticus]
MTTLAPPAPARPHADTVPSAPVHPHAAARALDRVHARLRTLPHPVRVATIALVGTVLVLAGLAMLVLPGPGLVVMFAGVAVLSTEFPWASRLLHRMKVVGARAWEIVRTTAHRLRRRRAQD